MLDFFDHPSFTVNQVERERKKTRTEARISVTSSFFPSSPSREGFPTTLCRSAFAYRDCETDITLLHLHRRCYWLDPWTMQGQRAVTDCYKEYALSPVGTFPSRSCPGVHQPGLRIDQESVFPVNHHWKKMIPWKRN